MQLERLAQKSEISYLLQLIVERCLRDGALPAVLGEILEAAIAITHADMGHIQLFNPNTGRLTIKSQYGFKEPWRDYFDGVVDSQSVYGAALRQNARIVLDDLAHSDFFKDAPAQSIHLSNHICAMQCTPLRDNAGQLIGLLSTHYRQPGHPSPTDLLNLDQFLSQTTAIMAGAQANLLLQERETHYRTIFDGMKEGVSYCRVFYDAQGRAIDWLYLDANPMLERFFGVSSLAGRRASEIYPTPMWPDPELLAVYGRVAQSGMAEEFEGYIKTLNKWIRVSAFSPEPEHVIAIGEDITQRKNNEAQLKRSQLLSEALNRINLTLHSTLDFDEVAQRLLIEGTNALDCESAAISLREQGGWVVSYTHNLPNYLMGARMSDQDDPNALLAIQTRQVVAVDDALGDPRVNREHLRKHNIRAVMVAPLIVRNKTLGVMFFNYQTRSHAFSDDEIYFAQQLSTTAAHALDNARLFKQRAQTTAALRASEQRLNLALGAAELGLWDWNLKTNSVIWNAKQYSLFGLTPETFDHQAESGFALIHPEDRSHVEKSIHHALDNQEAFYTKFRVVHPDDSVHWIASRGQRAKDPESDNTHVIGVCFDVTKQRQADQERERFLHQEDIAQMQRINMAGEFAALLAHQLNQPLSAIRNFAEAGLARLRHGTNNPAFSQATFTDIVSQSERAAQAIRDLRTFLARQPQEMEMTDLNEQLRVASSLINSFMQDRKIRVILDLAQALPKVPMRASQIEQVIINLMENAVSAINTFSDSGGTIQITTQLDSLHNELLVTVRDSGRGLDVESSKRVFDALFTTKKGGIGMGLTISRSIIEDHGGRIWAEPGLGGYFKFTLPVTT